MTPLAHALQLVCTFLAAGAASALAVRLARAATPGLERIVECLGPTLARFGAFVATARRKLTPRRFRR